MVTSHIEAKKNAGTRNEMVGIQYIRGYAAILVVVEHANDIAHYGKYFGNSLFGNLNSGAAGVDLFFLISGFIITTVSLKSNSLGTSVTAREYCYRRFMRLIPYLWFCLLIYIGLRMAGRGDAGWHGHEIEYLRAFLLLPFGAVEPSQIWTLRHEVIFYIIFSSCFFLRTTRLFPVFIWGLLSILYWILFPHAYNVTAPSFAELIFGRVNVLFVFGLSLGLLKLKYPAMFPTIALGGPGSAAISCLLLALAVTGLGDVHQSIWGTLATGALCTPILYLAACHKAEGHGFGQRIAKLLGNASYSIYLLHTAGVSIFISLASHFLPNLHPMLVLLFAVISGIIPGILFHLFIEVRLIRFARISGAGIFAKPSEG